MGKRTVLVVGMAVVAALSGCAAHPTGETKSVVPVVAGTYQGPGDARIVIHETGDAEIDDLPLRLLSPTGHGSGALNGSAVWDYNGTQSFCDNMTLDGDDMQPARYDDSAIGVCFRDADVPYFLFYLGDPDEGHEVRFTLTNG